MKCLVFHGFLQTGSFMNQKTGQLRKLFPKTCTFVYPDAPFCVKLSEDAARIQLVDASGETVAETLNNLDVTYAPGNRFGYLLFNGNELVGVRRSIQWLATQIREQKPDKIIAFSQGATVLLCALSDPEFTKEFSSYITPAKLCLVSPFFFKEDPGLSDCSIEERMFAGSDKCLFRCMFGLTDHVIGLQAYEALQARYPNCLYQRHEGGHFIACSGPELKAFWTTFAHE